MSTQHTLTLPLSHSQAKNVMLLVLRSYHIIIQDQWLCVPKGNALDAVKPCSCSAGIHRRHSAHHLSQITIKLASPWPGPHDVIRKMVDSLTVSSRCICGASLHAAAVQDLHETHPGECNIPVKGLTIYLPMDTMAALVLTVNTNIDLSPWAGILWLIWSLIACSTFWHFIIHIQVW